LTHPVCAIFIAAAGTAAKVNATGNTTSERRLLVSVRSFSMSPAASWLESTKTA
jgi:hypothetical protein